MSAGKSVSYTIDIKALRAQEKVDALRRQREEQAAQEQSLRLSILKYQAEEAFARMKALADVIMREQVKAPGAVLMSPSVEAPPASGSETALKDYVQRVWAAVHEAEEQWKQKRASILSVSALKSANLAAAAARTGAPRLAKDFFDQKPAQSTPTQLVAPKRDTLAELREQGLAALRKFLDEQRVPLPLQVEQAYAALAAAPNDQAAVSSGLKLTQAIHLAVGELHEERQEAMQLIAILPAADNDTVREIQQKLQEVASGNGRLGPELRASVAEAQRAEDEAARQRGEVTTGIVRDALKNLGYTVEPIDDTMFVSGGVAHFRKQGWDESYYVRLKVDSNKARMDLDLVSTAPSERGDKETVSAWCGSSGVPELNAALQEKGLTTAIVRDVSLASQPVERITRYTLDQKFWEAQKAGQQVMTTKQAAKEKSIGG